MIKGGGIIGVFKETIDVTVRGFKVYVENNNSELYDFFIPTNERRIAQKDVKHLLANNDKIIAIKRDNQKYQMAIDDIEKFGQKIN